MLALVLILRPEVPQPEHPAQGAQPDLRQPPRLSLSAGRGTGRGVTGLNGQQPRRRLGRVHSVTHRAGSDSTPLTRTRSGTVLPAWPPGGTNEKEVPEGSTLNWPAAGTVAVLASGALPASTSVAPGTKPTPLTVNGPGPVRTGPPAGSTKAATLTGTEPLRRA